MLTKKASLTLHGARSVPGQSWNHWRYYWYHHEPSRHCLTTAPPGSAAGALSAPSTLGLLGVVAAVFLF